MKITKTNNELFTFVKIVDSFMRSEKETKLGKKMGKQSKIIFSCLEEYEATMEDLRLELCSVDERGNILYERRPMPNGQELKEYSFTKDAVKKLTEKARLLGKQSVEFECILKAEDLIQARDKSFIDYFTEFAGCETEMEELLAASALIAGHEADAISHDSAQTS